jgi:hypothetical protein
MDNLDKDIMNARNTYRPNGDFTKKTMKKIYAYQKKRRSFSWFKPFALSGTVFASAILLFTFMTGQNPSNTNSPSQTSLSPVTTNASIAQETAMQIASAIASLDKEVASYTTSYSDTALNDISQ